MATDENTNQRDDVLELTDEMLDEISGGEIVNWKTKITLEKYIKECKLRGLTLADAMTEIKNTYKRNERYANAFIDYVAENWIK